MLCCLEQPEVRRRLSPCVPAQTNGVEFASMVLKRERSNPRFAFLLPWNALHPVYRARAAAALTPGQSAELFPDQTAPAAEAPGTLGANQPKAAPAHPSAQEAAKPGDDIAADPVPRESAGAAPSAAQQQADLDAFSAAVAELEVEDTVAPGTEMPLTDEDGVTGSAAAPKALTAEEPPPEEEEAAGLLPNTSGTQAAASGAAAAAQPAVAASSAGTGTMAGLAANPPVVKGLRVRRAWDQRPEDLQPASGARRRTCNGFLCARHDVEVLDLCRRQCLVS